MTEPAGQEATAPADDSRSRRFLPTVFVWVGGAVLLATLFVGWYVVQVRGSPSCGNLVETLYPFWVTVSGPGASCPSSQSLSYSAAGLPSTGLLYLGVAGLTAAGAVLAFLVGALLLRGRRVHRGSVLLVLVLLAILTAWLGPAVLALEQPSTVCGDQGAFSPPLGLAGAVAGLARGSASVGGGSGPCDGWSFPGGTAGGYVHSGYVWTGASGPWNSFFGTLNSTPATFTWGPGVGWFLDIWGVALIGAGATISRKN